MDPREYVETLKKRVMAQTLEELELRIEAPLRTLAKSDRITPAQLTAIVEDIDHHKRAFRKRLHVFASDCLHLMPTDIEINAYEPVIRR